MVKEITSQEEFDAIMQSENADNVTWCPHCGKGYFKEVMNYGKHKKITHFNGLHICR